jgi:hypothetical protein
MYSAKTGLCVASVVFAIVSLLQLIRVFLGAEVAVNGHLVPIWASFIAFLVTGFLSIWMGRLSYLGRT